MSTLLQLRQISKRFGDRQVLSDLSLKVARGERFFILGPSGCGKTTLLRIVAGLEKDHQGEVELNGALAAGSGSFLPPHKRGIGYVFQDGALWPHLTVEKHLTYVRGGAENRAWHAELLELTGLASRRNDYPAALSGGEGQRLSLARALAGKPSLLLLDEPLRHLDRNLAVEMREAIVRILDAAGAACLFVTHDQEEALSMAHRVMLMDEQGPVQTGTPGDIFNRPETPWAAAFFGPVNRFSARCEADGRVQTPLGTFATDHPPGTHCEVLLRASQVHLKRTASSIPAQVREYLYQGDQSLVHCLVDSVSITGRMLEDGPEIGENLFVRVVGNPRIFVKEEVGNR